MERIEYQEKREEYGEEDVKQKWKCALEVSEMKEYEEGGREEM